jgi:hypothetical protein
MSTNAALSPLKETVWTSVGFTLLTSIELHEHCRCCRKPGGSHHSLRLSGSGVHMTGKCGMAPCSWPYQALPGNAEDMDHQMQLLISRSQQLSKPPPLHLLAYAAFLPNGCVSFEEFGGPWKRMKKECTCDIFDASEWHMRLDKLANHSQQRTIGSLHSISAMTSWFQI